MPRHARKNDVKLATNRFDFPALDEGVDNKEEKKNKREEDRSDRQCGKAIFS